MSPIISVIVPIYNVENYLEKCIESIVSQTYENIEIILVDDGSTDRCGEICDYWERKDNRVVVIHKKNGGLSSARNAGLKISTGNYIAFVDSDDFVDKNMYSKLYALLCKNKDCQIAMCDTQKFYSLQEVQLKTRKPVIKKWNKKQMLDFFYRVNGESSNTGVYKFLIDRKILNGFWFVDTLNEDVEASYEFFKRAQCMVVTNEKMYFQLQRLGSITHSHFKKDDLGYKYAWKRVLDKTLIDFPEYEKFAQFMFIRSNFTLLVKYYIYGPKEFNDEYNFIYRNLKKEVKNNLYRLLRDLPMSRKMLLVILVAMPRILPVIYKISKR